MFVENMFSMFSNKIASRLNVPFPSNYYPSAKNFLNLSSLANHRHATCDKFWISIRRTGKIGSPTFLAL